MIKGAPVSFGFASLLIAVVVGTIGFLIAQWHYSEQIAVQSEHISEQKDVIDDYRNRLQGASPSEAEKEIAALRTQIGDLTNRLGKWTATMPDRHMTDPGKSAFFESILSVAPKIQNLTVAAVGEPEARQYATEFMYVLRYAGITIPNAGTGRSMFPMSIEVSSTSERGLAIVIHDKKSPPDTAKLLMTSLTSGKFEFHIDEEDWIPSNATWLVVAPH